MQSSTSLDSETYVDSLHIFILKIFRSPGFAGIFYAKRKSENSIWPIIA